MNEAAFFALLAIVLVSHNLAPKSRTALGFICLVLSLIALYK